MRFQVTTVGKSTELQNVEVPGKKGRGWEELLTHAECQRLYKGKDFAATVRVEIPGQEIKILGKKTADEEAVVCQGEHRGHDGQLQHQHEALS